MSQRVKVKQILLDDKTNYEVTVKGWVRSFRNNQFIALNDGSTNNNLQIVIAQDSLDAALVKRITSGASISVTGEIIPSLGKGQKVELKAQTLEILGDCDPEKYPLQLKNRPSLEYLR
jgi:asparaginyl-tRNA synthetase